MKLLFSIVFCCLTFGCYAQTFSFESAGGNIQLSATSVNIPPLGHQKVQHIKRTNSYSEDIYSWIWIMNTVEYHFEAHNGCMFFIKTSLITHKTIKTIKILASKNDIKK